ncbi:MAG: hypothetical protein ACTSR2_06125 [Candidatus Hodarchaeales archaeon]
MFKGIKLEDQLFPPLEEIKQIDFEGIKILKSCVSLNRKCIEEFYMGLSELFVFYNLHLDKFIPYDSIEWNRNGKHVQTIVETKEQDWLYQTMTHYLKPSSIYLNENFPFKEK